MRQIRVPSMLYEFSLVKRTSLGELGRFVVDVGPRAVFQRPDDLHVRAAGALDVCDS